MHFELETAWLKNAARMAVENGKNGEKRKEFPLRKRKNESGVELVFLWNWANFTKRYFSGNENNYRADMLRVSCS